jgi:hypothetical protein
MRRSRHHLGWMLLRIGDKLRCCCAETLESAWLREGMTETARAKNPGLHAIDAAFDTTVCRVWDTACEQDIAQFPSRDNYRVPSTETTEACVLLVMLA